MIRICERCYGQVDDRAAHVRLAHIDHALPDGSIVWRHSFVHTEVCDAAGRGRVTPVSYTQLTLPTN